MIINNIQQHIKNILFQPLVNFSPTTPQLYFFKVDQPIRVDLLTNHLNN